MSRTLVSYVASARVRAGLWRQYVSFRVFLRLAALTGSHWRRYSNCRTSGELGRCRNTLLLPVSSFLCGDLKIPGRAFASFVSLDSLLKCVSGEQIPYDDRFAETIADNWALLKALMCRQEPLEFFEEDMASVGPGVDTAMLMIAFTWRKDPPPKNAWMTQWQADGHQELSSGSSM